MVDLGAIATQIRENVAKMDKKQTNHERIKGMELDELVDVMFALNIDSCEQIPFCKNYKKCEEALEQGEDVPQSMCKECLREWLQQEARG